MWQARVDVHDPLEEQWRLAAELQLQFLDRSAVVKQAAPGGRVASHSYLRKASLQVRQLLYKLEPDCQRPQLLVVHRAPSQTHRPHCGVSNTVVAVGVTVLGEVQLSQRAASVRHCVCQHVSERQFRQKVPCRLRPAEPCVTLSIARTP